MYDSRKVYIQLLQKVEDGMYTAVNLPELVGSISTRDGKLFDVDVQC